MDADRLAKIADRWERLADDRRRFKGRQFRTVQSWASDAFVDVPELLALVERLQAENALLRRSLEVVCREDESVRQFLGPKKVRRIAERTGLPIVQVTNRGGSRWLAQTDDGRSFYVNWTTYEAEEIDFGSLHGSGIYVGGIEI